MVQGQANFTEDQRKDGLFPRNRSYHIVQLSFHISVQEDMRSEKCYKEKNKMLFYYIMDLVSTSYSTRISLCVISV